ncbi:MAG: glycosyltransferase [Candidatus Dormibacteria bacterium]
MTRPITLIIPFYHHPELVSRQEVALLACRDDLMREACHIVCYNDSPDDAELAVALSSFEHACTKLDIPCTIITNPHNCGFVDTVNAGLARAIQDKTDALLLNSDAFIEPGTIAELHRIASLDEKFGFVAPRSTNASLATIPWQYWTGAYPEPGDPHAIHSFMARLPEYTIVPAVTGCCMLIQLPVLERVGMLDTDFAPGYNEENDFIFRANRIGFLAVLANRAFVDHVGSVSFAASEKAMEDAHRKLLDLRHPEYSKAVLEYCTGPVFRTEQLLAATSTLSKEHRSVLLDVRFLKEYYNGTFELAVRMLHEVATSRAWKERFTRTIILGDAHALAFHGIQDTLNGEGFSMISRIEELEDPVPLALRLAQPFLWSDVTDLLEKATHIGYYFLDAIADDCYYLRYTHHALHELWQYMADVSSFCFFLSEDARMSFHHRYGMRDSRIDLVAMPSCSIDEYPRQSSGELRTKEDPYLLVIGNHFEHKMVASTLTSLAAVRDLPYRIRALGYTGSGFPGMESIPSGSLDDATLEDLYSNAAMIVFPSNDEGFGFPIVKCLAYGIPLALRDTATAREVVQNTLGREDMPGVFYYSSDAGLTDILLDTNAHVRPGLLQGFTSQATWNACLAAILSGLSAVDLKATKYTDVLATRRTLAHRIPDPSHVQQEALRLAAQQLSASLSWKVTAPLRRATNAARRVRRAMRP